MSVPTVKPNVEVRYEVDFDTTRPEWVKTKPSADITMETPTGTNQQSVSLPLTSKQTGEEGLTLSFKSGSYVYISAQKDEHYGEVTCRIYVDDELISENVATGKYSIATCKGTAR